MRIQQALAKFGVRKVGFTLSQGNYQVGSFPPSDSGDSEVRRIFRRSFTLPGPGSGAGKGGGAGGSVRESGGGLGQYGAAQEEEYFFNKRKEQLEKIKAKLKSGEIPEIKKKDDQ